jgi:hypothetical protein
MNPDVIRSIAARHIAAADAISIIRMTVFKYQVKIKT